MNKSIGIDCNELQKLIDTSDGYVDSNKLQKLIGSTKGMISVKTFQWLIDKYPEPEYPKNGDAIYHGGYPLYNNDGSYKVITVYKKTKTGTIELEKIVRTPLCFTLRFRKNEDYVIIGWSVASRGDIFNKAIGRNYAHLQLLRNCNDIYEKLLPVEQTYFESLKIQKLSIPIAIFSNLKYYIQKYVQYAKIENNVKFIIRGRNKLYSFSYQNVLMTNDKYMPANFYLKYTK